MTVQIVALIFAFAAIAVVAIWTVATGSPPTPTSRRVRSTILAALPVRIPQGTIYELGAGWGGLSIELARRFLDYPVVGIELSPLPWIATRCRSVVLGPPNLKIQYGDFLNVTLADASLVVCFLSTENLVKLQPKLAAEMPTGALVLSSTFAMPGWSPVERWTATDMWRSPVYLYEITEEVRRSYVRGAVT